MPLTYLSRDGAAAYFACGGGFTLKDDRLKRLSDLLISEGYRRLVAPPELVKFTGVPFDLFQAGRKLSFNLGDIFPNLSYPVVAALDRGDLDALYEAQSKHAPGQLGDNATKEFVLRHLFGIAPELIKQPADLLRVLLRRHYLGQRIPQALDDRFIKLLRQSYHFDDWPLERLAADREALGWASL